MKLARICEFHDVQCAWARFLIGAGIAFAVLIAALIVFVVAMRRYRKAKRQAEHDERWPSQ
jgi:hypothetical protein